ncbi:MAG: tRNA lysidine(34) synthetase TilS [Gemmatimonadota bacterium]|nr:tRNA lysidine(34) synthetase TilS [Gemmatimonadota bacterium]
MSDVLPLMGPLPVHQIASRFAEYFGGLGLPVGRVLLGVSGGADSLALLHLMHTVALPMGFELVVAHADHGLHPDSDQVANLVSRYAASLSLPAVVGRLNLPPGASESASRDARRAWLDQVRVEQGCAFLILGHQRDDQVETVLMRVLAGSGPAGLAAMMAVQGTVVRPLLNFTREELAGYLAEAGWRCWQDPANADPRHTRSWLRVAVLPLLAGREPSVADLLVRVADQAGENRRAWDTVLEQLPALGVAVESGGVSVAAAPLLGYDSGLARTLIQAAGRRAGAVVGPKVAERVRMLVASGRSGAWVPLGGAWRAELDFGRLRIIRREGRLPLSQTGLGVASPGAVRWGRWNLAWRHEPAPDRVPRDGWTSWFIPGGCTVRAWHAGDRIRPRGGVGRRLVVHCMQDALVPRADRLDWPVLLAPEVGPLLWIPGICRAEDAVPPPGSEALRIDVDPG